MENTKTSQGWVELAAMHYNSALNLQGMFPPPTPIICYHFQQAAVKSCIGFLVYHDHPVPETNDLSLLCELCGKIDEAFTRVAAISASISLYEDLTPRDIEISEDDMMNVSNNCTIIMNFALNKLDFQAAPADAASPDSFENLH